MGMSKKFTDLSQLTKAILKKDMPQSSVAVTKEVARAPVACIRLTASRRILGKHQSPWDVEDRTVTFSLPRRRFPSEDSLVPISTRRRFG